MNSRPTLADIVAARANVYRFLKPTPLRQYPVLGELIAADLWIKHENHNPTCAFKVRGGIHLAAGLTKEERAAGLYTASTGNHGQSIAFGARAHGVKATIAVPEGANPGKVRAIRDLCGEVVFHGKDFDTAREWIAAVAAENGGRFVSVTEEVLIEGVGTYALEILDDLPEVDTIIVPVGAGSGACATAIVAKAINPDIEVIGVQSAQAPAMQLSWSRGQLIEAKMETFAGGLATRVPFQNTQDIMRDLLDDFVLVDDRAIGQAVVLAIEHTHNLPEPAGAAALAAALQLKDRLQGKSVVVIMSGGNLSLSGLRQLLAHEASTPSS